MKIMYRLLIAALLGLPLSAHALFDDCIDYFPKGQVPTVNQAGRDLCFDGFAVLYSPQSKKPIYTVEKLNRERLSGPHQKRSNKFYEEARLPVRERALLADYRGSGYDRGHNAPAADMTNERAMAQSFSLANMMPQARLNNSGIWAKSVEKPTRQYANRAGGDVYVFTGSVGNAGTIGRGRVVIPTHLFKLVFDAKTNRAWAYWVENINEARMSAPISYEEFVVRSGIDPKLQNVRH